ncbi:MAG: Cytochrome c family protein [Polyangiaceae bacterium]|jgi:mono/diheme cytochrome c family protein/rhodanese-related sulfurtransferase|nr:Cytochrome c family protein [Polyangiaceae bacterium]
MRFRSNSRPVLLLALAGLLSLSACDRGVTSTVPSATPSAEPVKAELVAAGGDPAVGEGAKSYAKYCALCHAKDGTGYAADNAPSLVSKTFLESASDELIAAGIRMGRPGTAMAAYGQARGGPLSEREIQNVVRFLRSKGPQPVPLPPGGEGDAARGKEVFEKNCQTCHGNLAMRGNAVNLQNPELLTAASPAFLRYAIVNGRPPTPMPSFQGRLSEQEIGDVVSFLWSFKPALPTPEVKKTDVPSDLPVVINPKGKHPKFTLRDGRFVSVEQVKDALAAKQRIVIIDARATSDWIQYHIPGAIPLPYHDRDKLDKVPNDGTWVVAYCACPHHASGEVVDALRAKNYPNTAVMDEGILFWKDRGYPLTGEAVKAAPSASAAPSAAKPGKAKPKP